METPYTGIATSVLLTQFSLKEWRLTTCIAKIIDFISDPLHQKVGNQKINPKIIGLFESLEQEIGDLCLSCLESLEQTQPSSRQDLPSERKADANHMVQDIQTNTRMLKNALETYEDKKLVEELVSLSDQANDLLELTAKHIKYNRTTVLIKEDLPMELITVDMDSLSRNSACSNIWPDGEGLASEVETSGEACSKCNQNIDQTGIKFLGKSHHKSCFLCLACQTPVKSLSFLTHASTPLCQRCTAKCVACHKPIMFECFIASNQTFHLDCFKCVECTKNIGPDDTFYRKDNRHICTGCFSRLANIIMNSSAPIPPPRDLTPKRKLSNSTKLEIVQIPPVPPRRKASIKEFEEHVSGKLSMLSHLPDTPTSNVDRIISLKQLSKNVAKKHGLMQTKLGRETSNLRKIFEKAKYADMFLKFCVEENIGAQRVLFFLEVERFKSSCAHNPEDAGPSAEMIYEKYLQKDSDLELLGLKSEITQNLIDHIKNNTVTLDVFDSIHREVYTELDTEILPLFLDSSYGYRFQKAQEADRQPAVGNILNIISTAKPRYDPLDAVAVSIVSAEKRYFPTKQYVYGIKLNRQFEAYPNLYPDFNPSASEKTDSILYRTDSNLIELCSVLKSLYPNHSKLLPDHAFRPDGSFLKSIYLNRSKRNIINEIECLLNELLNLPDEVRTSQVFRAFMKASETDFRAS